MLFLIRLLSTSRKSSHRLLGFSWFYKWNQQDVKAAPDLRAWFSCGAQLCFPAPWSACVLFLFGESCLFLGTTALVNMRQFGVLRVAFPLCLNSKPLSSRNSFSWDTKEENGDRMCLIASIVTAFVSAWTGRWNIRQKDLTWLLCILLSSVKERTTASISWDCG